MIEMLALAVVQGLTEFLPVSSSGHLVLLGDLVSEGGADARVNVVLHAGTLLAILVVYWRPLLRAVFSDRRLLALLILGTVPAAVFGLTVQQRFRGWLESPGLAAGLLVVNGAALMASRWLPAGDTDLDKLGWRSTLWIGCAQALAVLPGLSRSGSTILSGLACGLRRDAAATFAFLLAVPAIVGAVALEAPGLLVAESSGPEPAVLAAGLVTSFVVGLVALRWLLRWLESGRLYWFAWWCWLVAAVSLVRLA